MITLQLKLDVPEDRRVTIELPPETPVAPCTIELRAYLPEEEPRFFEVILDESLVKGRLPRVGSRYGRAVSE